MLRFRGRISGLLWVVVQGRGRILLCVIQGFFSFFLGRCVCYSGIAVQLEVEFLGSYFRRFIFCWFYKYTGFVVSKRGGSTFFCVEFQYLGFQGLGFLGRRFFYLYFVELWFLGKEVVRVGFEVVGVFRIIWVFRYGWR